MQSKQLRMSLIAFAAQMACIAAGSAYAQSASEVAPQVTTTKEGSTVVITGKKLGMGLMVTEDAPKARSTITAEELEKQRPTGNAYEALEMLPAVNSYNYDATGLFGGGMTLRGFNSDQIGATINGVPVNDSGSFAIYPQEYVDQENTCNQFVTQGSTDVDSPQVGATGGNFGITTCNPENMQRVRVMQTIGELNMKKTFVRYDTGTFLGKAKAFISASHAESDKWKGPGKADRNHIDVGLNYDWDRFNYIHGNILFNKAVNNNIYNPTLAEMNTYGYFVDYAETFKGHLTPVNGTAQVETTQSPTAYYGLSINPFKNVIASAVSKFRLTDNLDVAFTPYLWYGFGNGGTQQRAQKENAFYNSTTGAHNANVDLNGDGDFRDTILVANASVTKTFRPGFNLSVIYNWDNHEIKTGVWYEKARHQQTGPMLALSNDGNRADIWLQEGEILRPEGKLAQSRDQLTVSTAYQFFLQDTMSFMDDKAQVNVGIRTPHVKRDFTNYGDEFNDRTTFKPYNLVKKYDEVLPQFGARYRLTADDQIFTSIAKNMKTPPNFVFGNLNTIAIMDAAGNLTRVRGVEAETSWSTDVGYRHQDKNFIATVTGFYTDFKNRQVTSTDPETKLSTYLNLGQVKSHGMEIEVGNTPVNGWAFYGSLGYLKSEIKENMYGLANGAVVLIPTAGKEMINAPRRKAGVSVEYQNGPFWVRVKARATSRQFSSMLNDEVAPGYTTYGLDGGYTFANFGWLKRPKLTFNVSNLNDKQYRNASSTSTVNAKTYQGVNGSAPRYYLGAPRFASATLSVDF